MKIVEKKTTPVTAFQEEVISETVVCNLCGREFRNPLNKNSFEGYTWDSQLHSFAITFPFYSKFDNDTWEFDVCEDCLHEWVKNFWILPKGYPKEGYKAN